MLFGRFCSFYQYKSFFGHPVSFDSQANYEAAEVMRSVRRHLGNLGFGFVFFWKGKHLFGLALGLGFVW